MNNPTYLALCTAGQRRKDQVDRELGEVARLARLLQDAEETFYTQIDLRRDQLATARRNLNNERGGLMRHVAHCPDGCVRAVNPAGQALEVKPSAANAAKPPLPPMADVAARLRAGEPIEVIAADYQRSVQTMTQRLNLAGYNAGTGILRTPPKAQERPRLLPLVDLVPEWSERALCAQTDPELFFPERGGSSKDAKKVCAACEVRAECRDYALENKERWGVYGGLSERERRRLTKTSNDQSAA